MRADSGVFRRTGDVMNYDAHRDFSASYWLACRLLALRIGSARFETLPELYFIEQEGGIP